MVHLGLPGPCLLRHLKTPIECERGIDHAPIKTCSWKSQNKTSRVGSCLFEKMGNGVYWLVLSWITPVEGPGPGLSVLVHLFVFASTCRALSDAVCASFVSE